jgi:hypothetical protein
MELKGQVRAFPVYGRSRIMDLVKWHGNPTYFNFLAQNPMYTSCKGVTCAYVRCLTMTCVYGPKFVFLALE